MQSSTALILAALAAAAQAIQFDFSNSGFSPEAGVPITLKWSDAQGPVTITLKNGPSDDLTAVEVLTSGETDGEFTWTPSEDLPSDTYALEITDGTDTNYTPQFVFEGDAPASTASPSSTSSAASSTTTSTSSEITSTSSVTNTTMSSTTMSTTTTTSRDTSATAEETDSPTTTPVNQNGSQRLASSLALVIGAVAAFVAFN